MDEAQRQKLEDEALFLERQLNADQNLLIHLAAERRRLNDHITTKETQNHERIRQRSLRLAQIEAQIELAEATQDFVTETTAETRIQVRSYATPSRHPGDRPSVSKAQPCAHLG